MNQAGRSTRQMEQDRRQIANLTLVGAIILLILLAFIILKSNVLGFSGGVILIGLILMRVMPDLIPSFQHLKKAERRAERGAIAEERVGDILATLGEDFYVLNDIACPYGNIDHLVIGRNSGVFMLETKAHGGRIERLENGLLVNGKPPEKDFIAQALRNTYWLRDEIKKVTGWQAWITPLIVFTNAFVPAGRPVKGVQLINKKFLAGKLGQSERIDPLLMKIWEDKEKIESELRAYT
jgi:hypothetical protein